VLVRWDDIYHCGRIENCAGACRPLHAVDEKLEKRVWEEIVQISANQLAAVRKRHYNNFIAIIIASPFLAKDDIVAVGRDGRIVGPPLNVAGPRRYRRAVVQILAPARTFGANCADLGLFVFFRRFRFLSVVRLCFEEFNVHFLIKHLINRDRGLTTVRRDRPFRDPRV
jgi:hypothetical protein